MHAPLFAGLTFGVLCLLQYLRPCPPLGRRFTLRMFVAAGWLFGFGLATEVMQQSFGRSGTIHDAASDGLGILAALSLYASWHLKRQRRERVWIRRALLSVAVAALTIAWWAPVRTLMDVIAVHRTFPLLASFESTDELGRWYFRQCSGTLTKQDVTDGVYAMELTVSATSHPSVTMIELPADWSEMKTLELDVTLDRSHPKNVTLLVKVIDFLHKTDNTDTFRSTWELVPGLACSIRIRREDIIAGPDTRQLDLSKIQYLDLLVLDPGVSAKLRIDAVRLTL